LVRSRGAAADCADGCTAYARGRRDPAITPRAARHTAYSDTGGCDGGLDAAIEPDHIRVSRRRPRGRAAPATFRPPSAAGSEPTAALGKAGALPRYWRPRISGVATPMPSIPAPVAAYCERLHALGIDARAVPHRAVRDYREVLEELGVTATDCAPTLLLMVDGQPLLVVLRGDQRLDFKGLKKTLRARDLRLARAAEFTAATGLEPGAARSHVPGVPVILDPSLFEREYLTGGSGDFGCSVRYRAADLIRLPGSRVVECTVPGAAPAG
jgi:prolyl-tRNA editing enzyme YbaK/EbsC (Cys-tRNA(Pro) deacylase)